MSGEPHAHALAALKLAHQTPRCGAHCRRNGGAPCRGPAIKGKARCRMHGGRSTGPSVDGRRKLAAMRCKHGHRSRAAVQARSCALSVRKAVRTLNRAVLARQK